MYTRDKVLNYQSNCLQTNKNNILHDLILDNNTELSLKIIMEDRNATDNITIVNHISLGNTPLMLALKTGAIEIAKSLLAHPKINVHITDSRGLSALQWACMLRQDDVIKLLLKLDVNPKYICKRWYGDVEMDRMFPITAHRLYKNDIDSMWFTQYAMTARMAMQMENWTNTDFTINDFKDNHPLYFNLFYRVEDSHRVSRDRYTYIPPFCDHNQLRIPGIETYTDIMFHIRNVCTNLHWVSDSTEFISSDHAPCSQNYFYLNFIEGMHHFCNHRNAISVNPEILDSLNPELQLNTEIKIITDQVNQLKLT